jgi:hypothetical protein
MKEVSFQEEKSNLGSLILGTASLYSLRRGTVARTAARGGVVVAAGDDTCHAQGVIGAAAEMAGASPRSVCNKGLSQDMRERRSLGHHAIVWIGAWIER